MGMVKINGKVIRYLINPEINVLQFSFQVFFYFIKPFVS